MEKRSGQSLKILAGRCGLEQEETEFMQSERFQPSLSGSSSGRMGRMTTGVLSANCAVVHIESDTGGWRAWEFLDRRGGIVQHHPGVQGEDAFGRNQQGIDVDFRDPRLLDDQLAEADESCSRAAMLTGLRPRTPLSAGKMRVRSIMRRARVALSGGRPRARSLKTSTNWPPVPNNSTGPNCGSMLLPMISS